MTMKVERAAHDLVNILISSLDVEVALESAAGSATTISITIPKKEDIAELDLKPGMCKREPYSSRIESMCPIYR